MLRKVISWFAISFLFTGALSSCSPVLTMSSSHNIPMLVEKGDFQVGASTGTGTANGQAAYAATKHLTVMAAASYGQNNFTSIDARRDVFYPAGQRYSGELAFGYRDSFHKKWPVELFGGVERGYRNFTTVSDLQQSYTSSWYTRPFVQGDMQFYIAQDIRLALSFKTGYSFFDRFSNTTATSFPSYIRITELPAPRGAFSAEPALQLRFGSNHLNLTIQTGLAYTSLPSAYCSQLSGYFALGLIYRGIRDDGYYGTRGKRKKLWYPGIWGIG